MKYIQIFLEFQDIYSKNFNFLFDGKYKFHNKSGIYFSLFFNCFGIFLSIFFFKNEFLLKLQELFFSMIKYFFILSLTSISKIDSTSMISSFK